MTASGMRRLFIKLALAAIAGVAATGATVPVANAQGGDPACDWLGWRHPLCGGGVFSTPADDGIPGDNAAEGGIPAPSMVPNINGSMSPPGTPGAI